MAFSPKLPLLFCVVLLMAITQLTLAVRPLPATNTGENKQVTVAHSTKKPSEANPNDKKTADANPAGKKQHEANSNQKPTEINPSDKNQAEKKPDMKQKECVSHEGTVLIPGVGRYMVGTIPSVPTVGRTFLGGSVPAALNPRFVPGFDDTFVPNPGFEVPNPARGVVP